jgi:hypothetical protein
MWIWVAVFMPGRLKHHRRGRHAAPKPYSIAQDLPWRFCGSAQKTPQRPHSKIRLIPHGSMAGIRHRHFAAAGDGGLHPIRCVLEGFAFFGSNQD